jgi:hypothetical protein
MQTALMQLGVRVQASLLQLELQTFVARELAQERYQDPRRLLRHGYKVYSQNDEDGLIAEVFRRIGAPNRTFVEFGVETGRECNTLWLLAQGWRGLWIEANPEACAEISTRQAHLLASDRLRLANALVTTDSIDPLIEGGLGGVEVDFLSIDIDGNDYWVWQAIRSIRPRLVCIEYNATWRPPVSIVTPYDPAWSWDGTNYYGASLSALTVLGREKGYALVGCCLAGANAFFVREDLLQDKFFEPNSAEAHYEPFRGFLNDLQSGHIPGFGELVEV